MLVWSFEAVYTNIGLGLIGGIRVERAAILVVLMIEWVFVRAHRLIMRLYVWVRLVRHDEQSLPAENTWST
jgi:hypothetical protein